MNFFSSRSHLTLAGLLGVCFGTLALPAVSFADCKALPNWKALKAALAEARAQDNGGLNLDMWGALVNRDGDTCAVAFTGADRGSQWPGSRVISVQKANTANAFSLPALSLSTANLYSAVQPGGSLFGLQESNPVRTELAYAGNAKAFGQANDPLVGKRLGGVNVFGGGLALYDKSGTLLGALGVSGDTSCADHNIAWRTRKALGLDFVPAGVGPNGADGINYLGDKETPTGFKHPSCGGKETTIELPAVSKKG
ncbi:MAG: heme-binding protein [Silvanigrellales bacterium]|nr:heme-binding protein [Silvanigrellales bacterium]